MNCTTKKISNIASIVSGVYASIMPDGDVSYLQMGDFLKGYGACAASKVHATGKVQANLLEKGNILFACKGSRYLAVTYNEDVPAVASTVFFVLKVKNNSINPEYLCWYLNQPTIKTFFRSIDQGTGVPVIKKMYIENLEIPIPDGDTQRKIVELSNLSDREFQLRSAIAGKKHLLLNQKLMNLIE